MNIYRQDLNTAIWQVVYAEDKFWSVDFIETLQRGWLLVSVELRPGESQDSILKRFRKAVAEARILPIVRQKRWFTSKSEIRRIKKQKAIRKARRTPQE